MTADQAIFMCQQHQFVTVVRGAEVDCHGTPGHRAAGCEACDKVVADAFDAAAAWEART